MIISLQKFSKLQLLFFHQLIFLFFLPIFQCLQFVQQKTRVFQVTCNLESVQYLNLRFNMLRQRYSSYYSRKILFDGQLWRSVGIFPWYSLSLWSKFSFKKIKSNHYGILEGYQATLSGAKSEIKIIQNAPNGPIFWFHMEVIAYQRSLGKEKIISIQGQSEKIHLKILKKFKFQ